MRFAGGGLQPHKVRATADPLTELAIAQGRQAQLACQAPTAS